MKARWWKIKEMDDRGRPSQYQCNLCFHQCLITPGTVGRCGMRGADETGFISPGLGNFYAFAVDPMEKKPLYHFQPGTQIFSVGGLGCNMNCPFCQNHHLSHPHKRLPFQPLTPADMITQVVERNLKSVAYTYNEPLLQAEFILETAPLARERDIATVLVTNGMFSEESLKDITPWVDAANIDLKTFNAHRYAQMGGSLTAAQRAIRHMAKAGVHVEVTTLVVPGVSNDIDEFDQLVEWLASVSKEIPLHVTRYFPAYNYAEPPTDLDLMETFRNVAKGRLTHVHLGNVPPTEEQGEE